ncbi:MAG: alpha/beta hydrolase [Dehalococcoidia bacterium]|nr:alpha/beta hydrolase [Dehalococcoidia bacterium]
MFAKRWLPPGILFFHGNGEVACDYDGVAPLYKKTDVSLFVADFRGYGRSDGRPGFSSMLVDAHPIFETFCRVLRERGHTGPIVLMGRSLGVYSTIELALHYTKEIVGIIVENGAARMARLLSLFGPSMPTEEVKRLEAAILSRVRSITIPVLIIHGEYDSLIPAIEAVWLH